MLTLKKNLGQHFLHDENICRKIVEQAGFQAGMNVLEVGPGAGAISKYIIEIPGINYKAIEIDIEKVNYLLATYPQLKDKIITGDILKAEMPFAEPFHLIGNFPYNISSPILFKALEWEPNIISMVGMFQKEVGERVAAKSGSKTYGILSVLMQAYFKVEYLFDVHENCFTPPPKVKSGVLRFTNLYNPYQIQDRRKFKILVKTAFGMRRKTLRNALKSIMPLNFVTDFLMDKRAEQLSVADFVQLQQVIFNDGRTE